MTVFSTALAENTLSKLLQLMEVVGGFFNYMSHTRIEKS